MIDGKPEQTAMNNMGTAMVSGTRLTQRSSRPVLYVARDKDGKIWGPFDDPTKIAAWAEKKWPGVPFREDADELAFGEFWDMEPIYPTN